MQKRPAAVLEYGTVPDVWWLRVCWTRILVRTRISNMERSIVAHLWVWISSSMRDGGPAA